ncbi:MAG: alpha-ribazole phosphatase [Bacteroidaceae bacterium]|nr:alpha-ribazole phosphatase [Bacteroidaceae bacterium]
MKVYLIRHTSPDVPKGTCYGQTDVPVAPTFPEEAAATLAAIPDIRFDMVYSSPLTRASKLAAFCGYPAPRLDNRLKELNFGRWEMQMYDEIDDPYIQEWYNNFVDAPIPGGESFREMYRRISDFMDELKQKDFENVLIFAHGGVLACARVYAGLCDLRHAFENLIPFGGMISIEL